MASVSFDRAAAFYDETRGGEPRGQRFADRFDEFLEPASRILEICVGTGVVAAPLKKAGHQVVGIDISPAMLDIAASRLGGLVQGDSSVLPFASHSVDAVVAVWAVHQVGDQEALKSELQRVLKPGGLLLLVSSTPDIEDTEFTKLAYRVRHILDLGWDRAEAYAPELEPYGFGLMQTVATDEFETSESPNKRAQTLEDRIYSSLWNVSDERWASDIQPIIDALRALQDPDAPRTMIQSHQLAVYQLREP